MTHAFVVPGPPVPKGRPRLGRAGVYTPKRTEAHEHRIRVYAIIAKVRRRSGPFQVRLRFYCPDARRRDTDNLAKCVLDALNGVAWDDDHLIASLSISRAVDRENPRTEIEIEELP